VVKEELGEKREKESDIKKSTEKPPVLNRFLALFI
jgi:hypothetical protein